MLRARAMKSEGEQRRGQAASASAASSPLRTRRARCARHRHYGRERCGRAGGRCRWGCILHTQSHNTTRHAHTAPPLRSTTSPRALAQPPTAQLSPSRAVHVRVVHVSMPRSSSLSVPCAVAWPPVRAAPVRVVPVRAIPICAVRTFLTCTAAQPPSPSAPCAPPPSPSVPSAPYTSVPSTPSLPVPPAPCTSARRQSAHVHAAHANPVGIRILAAPVRPCPVFRGASFRSPHLRSDTGLAPTAIQLGVPSLRDRDCGPTCTPCLRFC
ncbi:hypothetical protein PLICRDRAFT_429697 [Plicaturopsis crispa FD-325 SS-3]|nr:hypothetical protein PLICRDRAFT_429697 [Plicaturopsis crispa FD-325 SS-3]